MQIIKFAKENACPHSPNKITLMFFSSKSFLDCSLCAVQDLDLPCLQNRLNSTANGAPSTPWVMNSVWFAQDTTV